MPAPAARAASRHQAQRSGATTLAIVALPLAVIVVAALGINWLTGSAGQAPMIADGTPALAEVPAATTADAGPTSRPPGPGGFELWLLSVLPAVVHRYRDLVDAVLPAHYDELWGGLVAGEEFDEEQEDRLYELEAWIQASDEDG